MKAKPAFRKYANTFEWNRLEKISNSLLICIPILLLLIVALPYSASGYWEDEIFSVTTSRSWSGLFRTFRDYENNMSLYYVILHKWMGVFGEGEIATHALSLLFALLTIPVFYILEREWLNKSTAFCGSLLLAANPLFMYYSIETRSYSLLVLSVTVSTLIFVRLMRRPGWLLAFCYGLSVAAGVYIHYLGIMILSVHMIFISRKNLTRLYFPSFLVSGLVILFGLIPLFLFPPLNGNQIDWISKPDIKYLGHTIKDLFGGGYPLLVLFICLFFGLRQGYKKFPVDGVYYLPILSIVWAVVPVCFLFLFSWLVKPVFLTRFFVWCIPGAVLISCLIVEYTGWDYIRKSGVWILLLFILLKKTYGILPTKGSGYKDAVQYLYENIQPGESVLTYPYYKGIDIEFYLDKMGSPKPFARPLVITKLPFLPGGGGRDPDPDMDMLRKIAANNSKVYLIFKEKEDPANYESLLNRSWLPEIRKLMLNSHSKQNSMVFGSGSQEPIRIIVYE